MRSKQAAISQVVTCHSPNLREYFQNMATSRSRENWPCDQNCPLRFDISTDSSLREHFQNNARNGGDRDLTAWPHTIRLSLETAVSSFNQSLVTNVHTLLLQRKYVLTGDWQINGWTKFGSTVSLSESKCTQIEQCSQVSLAFIFWTNSI